MLEPSKDFFQRIPTSPGVYLMKDGKDRVVYVGKAKNLRNRVRQYFRTAGDQRYFVAAGLLGRVVADVETVVVANEKEALLLENHLIKKHQPRFNIKLRDDKQYLVLRIDSRHDFPRVDVVRNIKNDGARYFGPYHSATSCRETLRNVNRHFQLRTCSDHVLNNRSRPCLQYQIKRCPGPCVFDVERDAYAEQVEDVQMFLSGNSGELVSRLRTRMDEAARVEEFERAAQARDSIAAVERTLAKQNVVQEDQVDQDVFGLRRNGDVVDLMVLFVRSGKFVGQRAFRQREQEFTDAEVVANFVQQYYATGTVIPDQVIVPCELDEAVLLADWLTQTRGGKRKKVRLIHPKRGQKTRLLELANKNAENAAVALGRREQETDAMLDKLMRRLMLRRLPRRIECFDIAHIQGASTVASMVTFIDGEPEKTLYRKFKIKNVTNDDFAAMYEVLARRYKRSLTSADEVWAKPDLLVVDGGKGQLGKAMAALSDLGIETVGEAGLDVVALAKERDDVTGKTKPDRVFRAGLKDAVWLRQNTTELFVLSRIRDEAHRFANTFHRQARQKKTLRSALDDIQGIGAKRRTELLRSFGSVKAIRSATVDELAAVRGMTRVVADAVHRFFHPAP